VDSSSEQNTLQVESCHPLLCKFTLVRTLFLFTSQRKILIFKDILVLYIELKFKLETPIYSNQWYIDWTIKMSEGVNLHLIESKYEWFKVKDWRSNYDCCNSTKQIEFNVHIKSIAR
jgi:hypothetical protein